MLTLKWDLSQWAARKCNLLQCTVLTSVRNCCPSYISCSKIKFVNQITCYALFYATKVMMWYSLSCMYAHFDAIMSHWKKNRSYLFALLMSHSFPNFPRFSNYTTKFSVFPRSPARHIKASSALMSLSAGFVSVLIQLHCWKMKRVSEVIVLKAMVEFPQDWSTNVRFKKTFYSYYCQL